MIKVHPSHISKFLSISEGAGYYSIIQRVCPAFPGNLRTFSTTQRVKSKKTVMYDYHISNEGKMVDFANYLMPVSYGKIGIASSHKHVRSQCGIFDVSHMLQTKIHGKDRVQFMESLIVGDIDGLKPNTGTLSLFTNEKGGIMDDLICSKVKDTQEYLYVVSNAGCREKDLKHMMEKQKEFKASGKDAEIEVLDDFGLIAVQGPKSSTFLQALTKFDLSSLRFMNTAEAEVIGETCRITRCGYTGEDGFEISVPNSKAVEFCENLISTSGGGALLTGLGARDSLRLEAGLCLYGNDIDETTTPVEAVLAWTIGKRRREKADFPGAKVILTQLKEKPKRKRVGLVSEGPPARSHCSVFTPTGEDVGQVTSGCPSPSLGVNVAMTYVPISYSKPGTKLQLKVRNKMVDATVTKMPFVQCNYFM